MNMQAMLKQAQNLQKDMLKAKKEIDETEFVGESSNIKITMNGTKKVLKVEIKDKETIETDDLEMLEDMILVAVNDTISKIDKMTDEKMGRFTNGMPGLF